MVIKEVVLFLFNYGLLTNAINLGNISQLSDVDTLNNQIEASGIAMHKSVNMLI